MHWIFLAISSLFEVGWMYSLKATEGFTRLAPIASYAVCGAGSAYFLSLSMKKVPMVTAYSIWIGAALVCASLIDLFFFKKPYRVLEVVCMGLIAAGVVGLKLTVKE